MLFFSRWPGTATAHTYKFVGVQLKKKLRDVDVSQTCVSSEKKLILARIGLFGDTKAAITRYTSNIVHNLV